MKKKTPFEISELNEYTINDSDGKFIIETQSLEISEFIVEACNNYERLQSENISMRELLNEIELEMRFTQGYNPLIGQIQTLLNPK